MASDRDADGNDIVSFPPPYAHPAPWAGGPSDRLDEPIHALKVFPSNPVLVKQTYASPMSYVGSARRTTAAIRKFGTSPAKAAVATTLGALWIGFMWVIVLPAWYFVTIFMFGLFT